MTASDTQSNISNARSHVTPASIFNRGRLQVRFYPTFIFNLLPKLYHTHRVYYGGDDNGYDDRADGGGVGVDASVLYGICVLRPSNKHRLHAV